MSGSVRPLDKRVESAAATLALPAGSHYVRGRANWELYWNRTLDKSYLVVRKGKQREIWTYPGLAEPACCRE